MKSKFVFVKDFCKKQALYLLAFALPVLMMLFIFILRGIYPFGDGSFLHVDMYHQYFPFLTEFYHKLKGAESLFYSWNTGIGSNFLALYVYYLASPFNWLVIFCPEGLLIEFMTYLVVLKIGLCGFTFSYYLSRHFDRKDFKMLFFAVFYAMSGYFAAYNWNVMWLDCIVLAPIIILGLEALVEQGKYKLYCITLALAILSNYYICIMICIYLVLYFFVLLLHCQNRLRACIQFALYSLLAGGMAAVLLIPELAALHYSEFASFRFPKTVSTYFSVMDMLARHSLNVTVEIGLNHWPNLYCGVAVLFLVPLYIMGKNISTGEKIGKLSLLAFMLISFSTNILNFIWHGFNYPDSLPCRQSFLYIILILTIAYEALSHLREYSRTEMTYCFCGVMFFILLCEKLTDKETISPSTFLFTGILLLLYAILMNRYRKGSETSVQFQGTAMRFLAYLTLILVIFEATVNMAVTSVPTVSRPNYVKNIDFGTELTAAIRKEDKEFYRIEKFSHVTQNDAMLSNFPSASLFSSTANSHVKNFFSSYGMRSSRVFYSYEGATPITSSLLHTKYMLSQEALTDLDLYTPVMEKNGNYLYENKYILPFGFVINNADLTRAATNTAAVDYFQEEPENTPVKSPVNDLFDTVDEVFTEDAKEEPVEEFLNPLEKQNLLLKSCNVNTPVFVPVPVEETEHSASIPVTKTGHIYAYTGNRKISTITASVNGSSKSFKKLRNSYILDLGYQEAGSVITLLITEPADETLSLSAYSFQPEAMEEWIASLSESAFQMHAYSAAGMQGSISMKKDGQLVLSVPYEPGWNLYVDGIKSDIALFEDTFISVPLTAGDHVLSLSYFPAGLIPGIAVSTVSLLIFLGILYQSKRRRKIN